MPKQSKSYQTRVKNLEKARSTRTTKASPVVPTTTVPSETGKDGVENQGGEEVFEGEFPEMMFIIESDDEEDGEASGTLEGLEEEISDEDTLQKFIQTLNEAQKAAQAEERCKEASNKHPKFYTGNSLRSQHRWAAKRRALAADGKTQFISSFFKKKDLEAGSEVPTSLEMHDVIVIEDSSDESSEKGGNAEEEAGSSIQPRESSTEVDGDATSSANEYLQQLLSNLGDYSLETATDQALGKLDWRDFPALCRA
ncbi:hypothetical protein M422DRAFT_251575 [Sphaerobolus stellatus SS14]|uniref:Uncharacterized protein n=1 Tax=Sphaerobolus stellatus (strain SS14) TaxID=990650 RepID=A0A0C9VRF2_SPHS4|nr:hypothetical protein M422DRAFT_251575 [Sphaerobolus stellatus SS14]